MFNLSKYIWRYAGECRKYVVLAVVLKVISEIILLMEPLVIGRVFNSIQFSVSDPYFLSQVIKSFCLLLVIMLAFWAFHGPSRILEKRNAFFIRKNYKKEMFDRVLHLPAEWHRDHHSGDTIDKVNKSSEALFDFSSNTFTIIESITKVVGSIIILIFFDWRTSIVSFGISVIAIFSIAGFDRKIVKEYKAVFRAENRLASGIHDYISNVLTVITLRLRPRVSKEIDSRSMAGFPAYQKNNILSEVKWFWASFLISLMVVVALIMSAYTSYTTTGVILIGTLFTLYRYLQGVGETFYIFAWRYGEIIREDAAVRAAEGIEKSFLSLVAMKERFLPKNWKTILIKKLNFSYRLKDLSESKSGQLTDVFLAIPRRKKIAFVGESGSGKSTALAILRGLYYPQSAQVFCDGKKMKHGLTHLYEHITLVPQEPEIFNTTIEDNVTMGISVSKKEIEKAVEIARFQSVATRLFKGLKTSIMEKGVNLSGGEKQRLALARGILAAQDSDFLFLDEPTSSVDSANELQIYQNIFEKLKEKTIISSVHRLHLLRYFDYIYYFKGGRILTEGTFHSMLEDEHFKVLWGQYNTHEKHGHRTQNLTIS